MKLDHTTPVLAFDGSPIQEPDGNGGQRPASMRSLAVAALNDPAQGAELAPEDKARCYELSVRFFQDDKVELTVEEAAFIQARAGKTLTVVAYGRLVDWIEQG